MIYFKLPLNLSEEEQLALAIQASLGDQSGAGKEKVELSAPLEELTKAYEDSSLEDQERQGSAQDRIEDTTFYSCQNALGLCC